MNQTTKERRRSFVIMTAVLTALLILTVASATSGCGGATSTTTARSDATTASATTAGDGTSNPAPAQVVKVAMKGFAFAPTSVTIRVGDTVTWQNQDSATHNVVADDGSFKSQDFGKGGSFSFTFSRPGTYPYSCTLHPNMKGEVVVQ